MNRLISRCSLLTITLLLICTLSGNAADSGDSVMTETGTVLETKDAADYTYLNVQTNEDTVWVAIPATTIKVGEEVTYRQGMVMNNFHSKTLNRTFESIIFSPGLVMGAPASPSPAEEMKTGSTSSFAEAVSKEAEQTTSSPSQPQASGGSAGATVPYMETEVEKADGENGYTVAEIFSKADSLDGKQVRVRGKVVKVSPNIMGKNWIHIQDGTGDPMQNSHDLVITGTDMAEVDEIVVATGTMAAKKDFGFGYKYEAIIEEATLSK